MEKKETILGIVAIVVGFVIACFGSVAIEYSWTCIDGIGSIMAGAFLIGAGYKTLDDYPKSVNTETK